MLELKNVSFQFSPNATVLNEINLKIAKGEFVIIAGNNGSGKTVLIRHFNGLYKPTAGNVFYNGKPIFNNILEVRKKIGMVFQDADTQILGQTVYDDVSFGLENLKVKRSEINNIVPAVLKSVGLSGYENRNPSLLSGGEKKRVIIAGILAMNPEMIVFDEPFTGLDFPGVKQILSQILQLHAKGHSIVVITHDLNKILAHAERIIVLDKGTIQSDINLNKLSDEIPNELFKTNIKIPNGKKSQMSWLL